MKAICTQYNLVLKNSSSFKMINSSCSWTCLVLACPTTLLNLLLIITLATARERYKPCGILILNLGVTDLLNGLFNMPIFHVVFRFIAEGKDPCLFVNISMPCYFAVSFESFVIVTLIAVERYINVFHPFMHVSKLSRRNVTICVTISWISSIFVVIPLLVGKKLTNLAGIILAVVITGTAINSYCYFRILHKAKKTRVQIRNETARFSQTSINSEDRRFLFIGALIITSMLACFSIAAARSLMSLLGHRFGTITDIGCLDWTLVMSSSVVNPFITCTFCPNIRRRILRMLTFNAMHRDTNH